MSQEVTRVVDYEEIVMIAAAGSKKNEEYNPVIEDHTIYVDIVAKVVTSANAMMAYCRENEIPFTNEGDDLLRIRVVTMRDTFAEQKATEYMRKKHPHWNGSWTPEFIGYVVGWREAMQHDPKLAALLRRGL